MLTGWWAHTHWASCSFRMVLKVRLMQLCGLSTVISDGTWGMGWTMGSALYCVLRKSVKQTENSVPISSCMSPRALLSSGYPVLFHSFHYQFWVKILLNDFRSVAFLLHSPCSWICEMNCPLRIAQVPSGVSIRKRYLFVLWWIQWGLFAASGRNWVWLN